jgi:hypothetical protein
MLNSANGRPAPPLAKGLGKTAQSRPSYSLVEMGKKNKPVTFHRNIKNYANHFPRIFQARRPALGAVCPGGSNPL